METLGVKAGRGGERLFYLSDFPYSTDGLKRLNLLLTYFEWAFRQPQKARKAKPHPTARPRSICEKNGRWKNREGRLSQALTESALRMPGGRWALSSFKKVRRGRLLLLRPRRPPQAKVLPAVWKVSLCPVSTHPNNYASLATTIFLWGEGLCPEHGFRRSVFPLLGGETQVRRHFQRSVALNVRTIQWNLMGFTDVDPRVSCPVVQIESPKRI